MVEFFGSMKLTDPGWPSGVLEVANLETRTNGSRGDRHWLGYRGDTAKFQAALNMFARIYTPGLTLVLESTALEGRAPRACDWSIIVWVPADWHRMHSGPHSIYRAHRVGQPAPAPRLTVHLGTSAVDWSQVSVPSGLRVLDQREKVDGRESPAPFRGRVIDVNTGKGLANASIELIGKGVHDLSFAQGSTGPKGRFKFRVLPGDYWLQTSAPGFVTRRVEASVVRGSDGETQIALSPVGRLIGVVTQPDGTPARGARVQLTLSLGVDGDAYVRPERLQVVTDGDGRFELSPVPSGYARLIVFHDSGTISRGDFRTAHRVFPNSIGEEERTRQEVLWPREVCLQLEPK